MFPNIIFGVVFFGALAAFLITARINPDLRWEALGGAVIIIWFGLLFISFMFPEAISKLVPQLPSQVLSTLVPGLPIIWGVIISLRRVLSDATWRQVFLYNPSLIAAVLITSIFFLNTFGVLRGNLFIYACSIAMAAMGLLVVAAMFWRKESPLYPNLYRKIMNQPESAQKTAVKYPPAAGGIEVKSLEEILSGHKELLRNIDLTTETGEVFEKRYLPAIESYAQLVHLLPASENDHHRDVGGLLHHGLEVGYYTMAFGRASMYGKELGIKKRDARERWLFACFIAGLCHDLGKVADDMRVATDGGLVWSSDSARLMEWAAKNQVKKYYVDWELDRHKIHESFTLSMLGKVLTDDDREYISEFDKELSKQVILALTPSSGQDAPSIRPYNIRDMVQKADQQSVKEDKKKSRTPADLGLERPTPLVRHYHDGIQRLLKMGRWRINEPGAAAWVMGPDRGLYLVWPRCGMELYESLKDEGVEGSPAAPEVIADILAGNDLLVPAAPGDYYWRIKPAGMDGLALTVLRINPKFAPNLVNPFPSSLSGLVQTDEGESSWTYMEAGDLHEQASENSSGKVIPLHHPDTVMEIVNYDRIIREPAPGDSKPGTQKAPIELPVGRMESPEADKPSKQEGWLPIIITVFFHVCLVSATAGAILIYMKNQVDPEVSYKLALWMMMGNAMDTGLFVKILLLGLIALGITYYFQRSREKVSQEDQKAREITAEAQEIMDRAKQEVVDILADARREGGEIKKTAKAEAADIRVAAKEEAAEVRERARQEAVQEAEAIRKQAESDAAEVRESAERDAKGKKDQAKEYMNQLWSSLEGKAIKEGVPPEKLPELLKVVQKAEKDAEAMIARAEIQAKEATEDIIAQAKAEAAKIITQAQDQARRETEEALRKAKVQLADIYDQVRAAKSEQEKAQEAVEIAVEVQDREGQGNANDQSIQEDPPEDQTSPGEDMDDQGEVGDKVAALEERIWGILSGQQEMKKRDLERKGHKDRYGSSWELAISNLLASEKIIYDADSNTYRCQNELFQ